MTAVIDAPRFRRSAGPEVVIDLSAAVSAAPTPAGRRRRDATALLVAALAAFLAGAAGYLAVRPEVERGPAFFAAPHETSVRGEVRAPALEPGMSWAGPVERPMPVADPVRTRPSPDRSAQPGPQSLRR